MELIPHADLLVYASIGFSTLLGVPILAETYAKRYMDSTLRGKEKISYCASLLYALTGKSFCAFLIASSFFYILSALLIIADLILSSDPLGVFILAYLLVLTLAMVIGLLLIMVNARIDMAVERRIKKKFGELGLAMQPNQ